MSSSQDEAKITHFLHSVRHNGWGQLGIESRCVLCISSLGIITQPTALGLKHCYTIKGYFSCLIIVELIQGDSIPQMDVFFVLSCLFGPKVETLPVHLHKECCIMTNIGSPKVCNGHRACKLLTFYNGIIILSSWKKISVCMWVKREKGSFLAYKNFRETCNFLVYQGNQLS